MTTEDVADLEIHIYAAGEQSYRVEMTLNGERQLGRGRLGPGIVPWEPTGTPDADGRKLLGALTAGPALRKAWGQACAHTRRRIRLWIDEDAAELHALPWELLIEDGLVLSAQAGTPFSRYLHVNWPWGGPVRERPIRMLAAISSPDDLPDRYDLAPVDAAAERELLESALPPVDESALAPVDEGALEVEWLAAPVTLARLEQKLREGHHILHFVGHGTFSEKRDEAALLMQDEGGGPCLVHDHELAGMLGRLGEHSPRLVTLAACQSGARSKRDAFAGLGPKLVLNGVPAVVAMQDWISFDSARRFVGTFYGQLLAHGEVDVAANGARSALLSARRPDAGVPVLFMRLRSGRLWEDEDATAGGSPGVPLQRPPRTDHFVGREAELARLLQDLQPGQVVTLCGPGGMGKTALATEAIWALAPGKEPPARFPDGIITHSFYNQPQADHALEAIVRAYGEEPRPTLRDAALRALSGRRALLHLDGTEQADDLGAVLAVRGGCGVLVTSRSRGDALSARQDIALLPRDEAVRLLRAWGGEQVGDEDAAARICALVGGLPLAVRLVGRYLVQTGERAGEYVDWLKEKPLEALSPGEHRDESVELLLARSVAQVGDGAREALSVVGLLALLPFSVEAAAAAVDAPPAQVRRGLGELVGYGLLLRSEERYEVGHALIHAYARDCCEPAAGAWTRLAAHYTALVGEQSALGAPGYARLDAERAHVLRVVEACSAGHARRGALALLWATERYLLDQGHWTALGTALRQCLDAARALGDSIEEANCIQSLGDVHRMLDEYGAARERYEEARPIFAAIGDRLGEANCIQRLGDVHRMLAEYGAARERYEEARPIYAAIGDRYSLATTLTYLGRSHRGLGDTERARQCLLEAVRLFEEIGSRWADWARGFLEGLESGE